MIERFSFQTKARTVDHLGREQIADTPTAISELWKNSFDAYAGAVELNIYGGEHPVAVISDDGHGMNRKEFIEQWLVVGTETKFHPGRTPVPDRNGLRVRETQGQKGIGRLSCANIGPVLLFLTKRKKAPFVAALVDWRLFENPYLHLADIELPVTEFSEKEQLFDQLPLLVEELAGNIEGGKNKNDRTLRVVRAWSAYDDLTEKSTSSDGTNKPPSKAILEAARAFDVEERHLMRWPVWTGKSKHGTALVIWDINYDLRVQLKDKISDSSAIAAQLRLFETLSSFVDPFVDPSHPEAKAIDPQFSYAVNAWIDDSPTHILGGEKQFDRHMVDPMEHIVEGAVDDDGVFRGRIKAFGTWLKEGIVIEPPNDLIIPVRADTKVGKFNLYIASMEFSSANTTHTQAEFVFYADLAKKYAGFLIYRDGLRVMPYGRPDNDFFEIESRRSKSAGREFWNHRQMFGRLAISRGSNPNLKDKAGREGLLDNRAAKTLKVLVSNILMQSARRYFGSASELRQELLPAIKEANKRERARQERNKVRRKHRKEFRSKLDKYVKELPGLSKAISIYSADFKIEKESQISAAQKTLEEFKDCLSEFRLPAAPKKLGALESKYRQFQEEKKTVQVSLETLSEELKSEIERVKPSRPKELLEKQMARNAAQYHHRTRQLKNAIEKLQKAEYQRIHELIKQRNKLFHEEATPIVVRLESGKVSYLEASNLMALLKVNLNRENEDMFGPYIGALESLSESIDLQHLASFGMEELAELRVELERLNSLAQLGIAVEILGHELQAYDEIIGAGLKGLPKRLLNSKAVKDIEFGYEGLTDQLRFLSPLRLAGKKMEKWVSGEEIFAYLRDFFSFLLARNSISLEASDDFRRFRVYDQRSRLLPVFINLVNNSVYWLSFQERTEKQILLALRDDLVVVSDNGPGIDPEDLDHLFTLFFTKKIRGGRGVGLYLARANLAAGGHRIWYEPASDEMPLPGANFVIDFRGAEFDDE